MAPRIPAPRELRALLGPYLAPAILVVLLLWGLRFVTALPAGYDMPLTSWLVIWWPIGALIAAGAAIGLGRRAWERWGPATTADSPVAEPSARDWTWVDSLVLGACAVAGAWVVLHFSRSVNPEGALLGTDAPSYLENMLVAARGNWERYNTDKYILHGRLGAWLGALMGGDVPTAARVLAGACIAGLPPLTYLTGRAAFGRVASASAAAWVALDPLLWTYGVQTTNYALFAAVVTATLAAGAWVLARPRWWTWALLGLATALLASTMEKSPLVLGPIWFGVLVVQLWRRPARGWRGPSIAAGLAIVLIVALDPPVRYTPFGSLVVNQREELNQEMPGWTWDQVQRMDPARPSPVSHLLPEALKNGALEASLASATAPPDADVLRLVIRDEHQPAFFRLEPNTSIPPLDFRLRFNMTGVKGSFGTRLAPQLGLLALGLLALLLPAAPGTRRRWLPALLLLAVLPSLLGPISFKYNPRYLIHAFPAVALLCAGGVQQLAGWLVGGRRRPWPIVGGALAAIVGLCWLVGLYLQQPAAWLRPGRALTTAPLESMPEDLGADDFYLSLARTAAWLEDRPEPVIHDCGPVLMWISRPWDDRFTSITTASCRALLEQPPPAGELIIVSDRNEYRAEGTLRHTDLARSGSWELLAAWGPDRVPEGVSAWALRDHVGVYRSR